MEIPIFREEYESLIRSELKLEMIRNLAKAEDGNFGYSTKTSEMIDIILDIKRDEK